MANFLHLFQGYGIEIEYMLVDRKTLDILSLTDQLIFSVTGNYCNDAEFKHTDWSNELVLHLIEIKTHGPARELTALETYFQQDILKINHYLEEHHAQLLPTGMHPWMNPWQEAKLWPHEYNEVYEAYHRIFDCRGHGWSNVQSTHINLPFANDEEFARLHTAIRLLLPLLPALSASSPIIENRVTTCLDNRLVFYGKNQEKIPEIAGQIIPELVFSQQEYEEKILNKMYQAISPYDPEGVLQQEWLNSRGAIARFERNTIEIRLLDVQEAPKVDIAIAFFISAILKALTQERWCTFKSQQTFSECQLNQLLQETIHHGFSTIVRDSAYLSLLQFPKALCSVGELWLHLWDKIVQQEPNASAYDEIIRFILTQGNLAQRILAALASNKNATALHGVYQQLAQCLQEGRMFDARLSVKL